MNKLIGFLRFFVLSSCLWLPVNVHAAKAVVVFKNVPCNHFVAQGPEGFYLLEWQGGYNPEQGDFIVGNFNSYGFRQAYYPDKEQDGKVYVNGYKMSQDNAFQEYFDHCR